MHLWTEYEGRTIAGAYTLGKLLRSEGRNGFFATSDTAGHSSVIRLTEAHFDEEEQLKRWRQVAGIHQDNLIEIAGVGKTTFDGVALTYALMEPDDANLGDVLKERPLTVAETMQVAKSIAAALSALHAGGLVHEHVEPANVLAVGEVVKLRSDCVRECVADVEFNTPEGCAELRRRDIHDFGLVLLQCLTLEKEWSPAANVPEPFKRVIPHAIDGSWSLEQISSFLDSVTSGTNNGSAAAQGSVGAGASSPSAAARNTVALPLAREASTSRMSEEPSIPLQARRSTETIEGSGSSRNGIWAIGIAAAVIVALLAWHFLGSSSPRPSASAAAAPVVAAQPVAPTPAAASAVATSATAAPTAAPEPRTATPASTHAAGWYVIAYTYNHQGQAQTKADRLAKRHSALNPQVFSPSGHGPYLVSLGGPMTEAQARTIWQRARRSGMPRDTFVRRY